jgi:AcrR family transcriptional regulator
MASWEPSEALEDAVPAGEPADGGREDAEEQVRPRTRRRTLRREELLDAADTVIRRVGVKASAALIAQEAGVTKPIIYRHFGDLQDLYRALSARHQDRLAHYLRSAREQDCDLDRRGRLHSVVGAFFRAVEREPNLFLFLVQASGDTSEFEGGPSWFTRRFAEQIGAHLGREADDPGSPHARAMGYAMAGALTATGSWWLEERSISREVMVDAVTDLLEGGFPPSVTRDGHAERDEPRNPTAS